MTLDHSEQFMLTLGLSYHGWATKIENQKNHPLYKKTRYKDKKEACIVLSRHKIKIYYKAIFIDSKVWLKSVTNASQEYKI